MSKKLVIIGASGHGKVIADIALKTGYQKKCRMVRGVLFK